MEGEAEAVRAPAAVLVAQPAATVQPSAMALPLATPLLTAV